MTNPVNDFQEVLDRLPLGVLVSKQPEGTIVYINNKAADILQIPPESALGLRGLDFLVEEEKREEIGRRLRGGEGTVRLRALCRTMSGKEFSAILVASLVTFGEVPCIVIVSIVDQS